MTMTIIPQIYLILINVYDLRADTGQLYLMDIVVNVCSTFLISDVKLYIWQLSILFYVLV